MIADEVAKEIVAEVGDWLGIGMTVEQARALAESDPKLVEEIEEFGVGDTLTREMIGAVLIRQVMPGKPEAIDHFAGTDEWHWPMYGSDKPYQDEFYAKFPDAARAAGYVVPGVWGAE